MNTSGSATNRCLHRKLSWTQPLGVGARWGWPSACLLKGLLHTSDSVTKTDLVAYSVTKQDCQLVCWRVYCILVTLSPKMIDTGVLPKWLLLAWCQNLKPLKEMRKLKTICKLEWISGRDTEKSPSICHWKVSRQQTVQLYCWTKCQCIILCV